MTMPKEERDRLRHDLMASDKYSSRVWKLFDSCDELEKRVTEALEEASVFCPGCAKKETVVVPTRSGVVGLAAVHSSGMICIPNTVRALLEERAELERATAQ